jgi:hypothetical protein
LRAQSWKHRGGPVLLLCAVLLIGPAPAAAQAPSNVSLDSNEQIFSVLAALNDAGYDTGLGAVTGDSTRDAVRARLAKKSLAVVPQLKKFYEEHRIAANSGADLGQYLSLALLLGPPPKFALTVPPSDLPPDAKKVAGLIPLLRKFYEQADLVAVWASVQPNYQAAIRRYSDPVRRSIELTDAYLRFPSGTYLGRRYSIDMCLLGGPEQVQARVYGSNYFLVVTPSQQLRVAEIRHQYLHFLLDPLAVKYAAEIHQKSPLLKIARQAPNLGEDFKDDFSLLLTECLIRAVELRMDKMPAQAASKAVNELTASGLILVPHFYDLLVVYEKQEAAMGVFYRDMVEAINVGDEEKKLASVKFSPRPQPPASAPQPAASELERLLDQGDNAIFENRYPEARAAFQAVLEKFDPANERALFGMAIVASNTRKPDTAESYFRKVVETASDVRLVTWSHIYLGRLYDLKGERKQALDQYRAASLTASRYPEALRAVESGMAHPYGSGP